jgi:hypothetical protein
MDKSRREVTTHTALTTLVTSSWLYDGVLVIKPVEVTG